MMPNVANNRGQAFVIGVKFTLLAIVAALLCLGLSAPAADDVGRPTAPISRSEKMPSPDERQALFGETGNKFFNSLRFWERIKLPSQQKPPTATPSVPSRPREVTTVKGSVTKGNSHIGHSVQQSNAPATSSTAVAMDIAPEPPPIPYLEREQNVRDAPVPSGYARSREQESTSSPQTANAITDSYSSYSFDARDWIEFFPVQHRQMPDQVGAPSVTQPTSLHVPTTVPMRKQDTDEEERWNGLATALTTNLQRVPVSPTDTAPAEEPLIDLSPSYTKRLPYAQTCGVVVVQANFPLTEIASILEEINQLQYDLYRYIGVPAPQEKIELCLFRNEETYSSFLREFFPRAPRDRRALYVKLDNKPGTLMVQKTKDFEIDLRHEMTHAIIHASIPKVPIWLDEGLAKYFEVPSCDRVSNHPYMSQIRWNTKLGTIPSLDRLTKLETIDDMGAKEYRDSWAWTHFFIHRSPETHRLLAAYLQMLVTWDDSMTVIDEDFGGILLPGGKRLFAVTVEKQAQIPSLRHYLDDIVPNPRESFKGHFETK